jgi:ASC-1-like (ASCH) protein
MLHTFYLNDPWFEYMKSGEKIYECRLKTDTMKLINIGDNIRFIHYDLPDLTPPVYKTIEDILEFDTIEKAIESLTIKKVYPLPGFNMNNAYECYYSTLNIRSQIYGPVIVFNLKSI